ncbi:MAG: hypothetical protein H6712_08475 [Myxococcales bacterium]|nr:hypothetical protein [Myxococcales bacterium]MCB9713874.1 hypothetical protein [Myxococcales bacterium]
MRGSPVMPRGLTSFGAASLDGSLYVMGGYFGRPHAYSEAGQTGELLRLELETGMWSRLGAGPKAQSVALVVHDGKLVRIGGMQALNREGTPADLRSLDTVEAFDLETSIWSTLPSLPAPRSSHDAVVLGDTLWVVGGWRLDGDRRTWHDTVLRLDLRDPSGGWQELPAPFERRALATVAVDGRLVVIGGIDSERNTSPSVDVLDPERGVWSKGPELPGPGFGVAAAADDGQVYASGMDGRVARWRPGEAAWSPVSTLAFPRFFHRMIQTDDGELTVIGGIRGMESGTRVRPLETIRPGEAGPSWLRYELESPLPSKNRQGVAIVDDSLVLFGGNESLGQHDFGPEFFTDAAAALDLVTMQWRSIAPYPVPRQTMTTFVAPWGQVVSVGGFGHDGAVARSHPEIYSYHPGKDQWQQIGTLPGQGRTQLGLAVGEGEVVIFGGLDYDPRRPEGDEFRHELGLLQAPLRPTAMDFVPSGHELREPRRAFAGARLGNSYYVVGGMKEGFELVGSCEAFELDTQRWSTIACPQHQRLSAQMVAMGGRLYLAAGSSRAGGSDELAPDPSLEVYDPETGEWRVLVESMPIEPKHLTMLAHRERLVLLSTHDPEAKATVMILDPGLPAR